MSALEIIGALGVYLLAAMKCREWRGQRIAALTARTEVEAARDRALAVKDEAAAKIAELHAEAAAIRTSVTHWVRAFEESQALYRYGAREESVALLKAVIASKPNRTDSTRKQA